MAEVQHLQWKVHLPKLFEEILGNTSMAIMARPLQITLGLMQQVAQRAIELDDPKLLALMFRLALYEQADPTSPNYEPQLLDELEGRCVDEGCPHHGTEHVCVQRDQLADRIEAAPDEQKET